MKTQLLCDFQLLRSSECSIVNSIGSFSERWGESKLLKIKASSRNENKLKILLGESLTEGFNILVASTTKDLSRFTVPSRRALNDANSFASRDSQSGIVQLLIRALSFDEKKNRTRQVRQLRRRLQPCETFFGDRISVAASWNFMLSSIVETASWSN